MNGKSLTPGKSINGNQVGAFVATYTGTYEALQYAIGSGEVRFAIHAQGLAGGESDTFVGVMGTSVIPEPGSALLALLGVAGLLRRRRS